MCIRDSLLRYVGSDAFEGITFDEFIELNELKKCLKFLEGIKDKSTLN